jgi:hypothetical protein
LHGAHSSGSLLHRGQSPCLRNSRQTMAGHIGLATFDMLRFSDMSRPDRLWVGRLVFLAMHAIREVLQRLVRIRRGGRASRAADHADPLPTRSANPSGPTYRTRRGPKRRGGGLP